MAVCWAPCRRGMLVLASGERHLERDLDITLNPGLVELRVVSVSFRPYQFDSPTPSKLRS
jgi:hypothetical protein